MNTWSARRKATYLGLGFLALLLFILLPVYLVFNKTPTCFDGKKNGSEAGVDCGGTCNLLCSFEAVNPTILWSRAFKVAEGVYSVAAYIENPNINSEALASYVFKLYDADNLLIATKENITFIPKKNIIAIFEPNIETQARIPVRATFEFNKPLQWRRNLVIPPEVAVIQKTLIGETDRPRIDAVIENESTETVERVEAVAIVYDDKQNAIAASRTFIDRLSAGESKNITFTWSLPFFTSKEVCRVPGTGATGTRPEALGVMLALDRSGSMSSAGTEPPQPLTDAKNAAISFVQQLGNTDQIGVVSFASTASEPVDSPLSRNYAGVTTAIQNIEIQATTTQYTNIADGLEKSVSQLFAPIQSLLTNRVIVLLTDGVANQPTKEGDEKYPENIALEKAKAAKDSGVEIFTIGLGEGVNSQFLTSLASSPEHYFAATTGKELADIYAKIAVQFCSSGPTTTEIVPRIIPARW